DRDLVLLHDPCKRHGKERIGERIVAVKRIEGPATGARAAARHLHDSFLFYRSNLEIPSPSRRNRGLIGKNHVALTIDRLGILFGFAQLLHCESLSSHLWWRHFTD